MAETVVRCSNLTVKHRKIRCNFYSVALAFGKQLLIKLLVKSIWIAKYVYNRKVKLRMILILFNQL